MVKIINAFQGQSPVASIVNKFGNTLFGDGAASSAYERERAYAADRKNVETGNLMDAIAANPDMRSFYSDPANLARIVGSEVSPDVLGSLFRQHGVSQYGVRSDQADEGIVGSGGSYSSSANAFDATLAENQRQFNQKPTEARVGGQDVFVPQQDAFKPGVGPIPDNTRLYPTKNYITPQGNFMVNDESMAKGTDINGKPLPQGGYIGNVEGSAAEVMSPPAKSQLEAAMIEHAKLDVTSQQLRSVIERAPNEIFGASGKLLSAGRGATVFANNVASLMGFTDASSARDFFAQEAASQNLDPKLVQLMFNPAHGEMELLAGLYIYQVAKAMYGQGGRDLSNQDVERVIAAVGTPDSWSMDKQRFLEKMNALDTLRKSQIESLKTMFNQGPSQALPNVNAPAQQPAPTTAAPAPQPIPAPAPTTVGPVDWKTYFGGQ